MVKIAKPESGATLATISGHGSSSNFVVESLDSSLQEVDLLVNEIGNYSGEVVLGAGPELIQIQSDGPWTLKTSG